jgi:pimeloyl-ACP methyl ester carboxylesterase
VISRRAVLVGAAAMTQVANAAEPAKGGTFVLIHGAWHGGWCWRPVQRRLEARGATVYAPSLTGLGDRKHLNDPKVNLSTHVADVVDLLETEELEQVVLVGHSYAGMVVTGAAAKVPKRLASVVYLDAFVPESGQSMFDLSNPKFVAHWREKAKTAGDGWRVPPMLDAKAMGLSGALAQRVDKKLTAQSIATFDEKLSFDPKALAGLKRAYFRAGAFGGFGPTAERVKKDGWAVRSIDSGHDVMLAHPDELAQALLEERG